MLSLLGVTTSDAQITHVVAGSWQTSNFHDPANIGCSIGGSASVAGGRLIMGASLKHPDPMVLVVRKTGWTIPIGTSVRAIASFTDGTAIQLVGVGQGQAVQFDLTGQLLRDWVHELTSRAQMRLSFDSNEPAWSFDLTGTATVINAMADCFKEHGVTGLSPPFGQGSEASGSETQPFGSASGPVPPAPTGSLPPVAAPDAGIQGTVISRPLEPELSPAVPSLPQAQQQQGASAGAANQPPAAQSSETIVSSWHGSSNMQTRPFHVDGPWELQWHNGQGLFSVTLHRLDGSQSKDMLVANGVVADSSSSYQPEGGDFYLEIEADASWYLQAVLVPSTSGGAPSANDTAALEGPLLSVDGDQSGLPPCDGPDAAETVTHLIEQSPLGQTLHIKVLHVGTPKSHVVRGGMSVCSVTLMTNGGDAQYSYQFYRKDGEIYVYGKPSTE